MLPFEGGYARAVAEMSQVMTPRRERRRQLIRRSDALLHQLEQVNVEAYRPYRPEPPVRGGRRIVRLPAELAQVVNELLTTVGLPVRRLRTTTEALEAVWAAQRRILGQPDEDEEEG